jgi:hypothetical protein
MTEIEKNEEHDHPKDALSMANDRLMEELVLQEDFSGFTPAELAEHFEEQINVDTLLDWMQAETMPWSNRKEFCEMLGVGESTLFGWLKGDRIPKTVKLIIGLFCQQAALQEKLAKREKAYDRLKNGDRLVRDGDGFMIVEFRNERGDARNEIGRIIAKNIPDQQVAERLMEGDDLRDFLAELESEDWLWTQTGEHSALDFMKGLVRNEIRQRIETIPLGIRIGR